MYVCYFLVLIINMFVLLANCQLATIGYERVMALLCTTVAFNKVADQLLMRFQEIGSKFPL